ncbi:MAG: hypothetical protein JXR77_17700, partial [Lentisphaeria bacterium]|nr:hypothetical protein [Lentisphaeria bacterium]
DGSSRGACFPAVAGLGCPENASPSRPDGSSRGACFPAVARLGCPENGGGAGRMFSGAVRRVAVLR